MATDLSQAQLAEAWTPNPPIRQGDTVLVSRDRNFADAMTGIVGQVHGRYADIIALGGRRPITYYECLEADDPWIEQRPHLFDDTENRAIFKLTESELERRMLVQKMADFIKKFPDIEGTVRMFVDQHLNENTTKRKTKDSS